MRTPRLLLIPIFTIFLTLSGCNQNAEQSSSGLYQGFIDPPASARPFVRWWWNDNRVTSEETIRELDIMKAAGIGGFEMNPISAINPSKASQEKTTPLAWLSPGWNEVVRATAMGARERGLIPDLLVGSGWPSGGHFLESGEQIQIITVNKQELSGPGVFSSSLKELTQAAVAMGGSDRRQALSDDLKAKLKFLRLVPYPMSSFETGIDLMDKVRLDGTVQFDIPEGSYLLYAGAWREGYREVVGGCLGAAGPVVDHLNKKAVRKYLDRMSGTLNPYMDGKMGNMIRAMFFDSFELGHTNWTGDFPEQFEKRRGYKLDPFLHFMVDLDPIEGPEAIVDTLRRLRYDFNMTLVELFMERFITTYTEWCHDNGLKSRAQAYGREAHPLDTSFLVDFPEGETWIWGAEKRPRPSTINRYVASAAHLSGKNRVSAESMTNPFTPFRIMPSDIKRTDDLNFMSGITHTILHGFNYSPPVVEFPGWVRFGCFFSEHNSWWPYFKKWADYNARISWVLQNSRAQARIAILTPETDIWSTVGRPYHPFAEREVTEPWYLYELWKAFFQNGYNTDYTSESILAKATFENGKINVGPRVYDMLILEDVHTLLPETAEQIEKLAKAGGKIVFIGQAPTRSPSYLQPSVNETIVKESIESCLEAYPEKVAIVPHPTKTNVLTWVKDHMAQFEVKPDVLLSPVHPKLSQIYHKTDSQNIFLFTWADTSESINFVADFDLGNKKPYVWDPETGARYRYPFDSQSGATKIHLEPLESLLLVFESNPVDCPAYKKQVPDRQDAQGLAPIWEVTFDHAVQNSPFTLKMKELMDIGLSEEERLNRFAGVITYRSTIEAGDESRCMLDLGDVFGIPEVWLNGKYVGVSWYGKHTFDLSEALVSGNNQLEIKVTTHLGNYLRGAPRNTPAGRYSWWYPVESMGLLGPVSLCKLLDLT